ncbi:helix-turn-helix domain-containing protein [Pseudobacter ginsenosidimutans]|uniref:Helix-turn-helix protein n=1 Tax=Pseudobacter ginsenosidimutans TaxID=661488 RepID=A0A4Q7N4D7_9BACT|nr:helix-turn-helix transcriptional regulator [Pseudobacter ginsenosidimutans]QEC44402.1 helix-turn-helix transcriptional regulator [Pseudobacter ginsenosidimutans]RZS75872.1 helix-turn-helix protein [Pseudobacter ginsenosidimutans]
MDGIISIIKKLRKFKGITQEAMAEQLHLSVRAYQKLESGQTRIDIDRLQQMAAILEVSISDLVTAKFNTENQLLRSKSLWRSETGVQKILEEWTDRLLHVLIKGKGAEMEYLNRAKEEGL